MRNLTDTAAALTAGQPQGDESFDPALLTITFGFGASIFDSRFGLAEQRPAALVDMPHFKGDKLEAEDTAVMTLRFENGVIGQCEDSWSLVGAMDSRFEVFGTEGRILIDNLHRQPIQVVSGPGQRAVPPGWSYPLPIPGAVADGHVAMLAHFVECLRTGAPSQSEAAVGWNALAVIEAAAASVKSGRRETVRTRR